jgi:hypothetical protein
MTLADEIRGAVRLVQGGPSIHLAGPNAGAYWRALEILRKACDRVEELEAEVAARRCPECGRRLGCPHCECESDEKSGT